MAVVASATEVEMEVADEVPVISGSECSPAPPWQRKKKNPNPNPKDGPPTG